MKISKEEAIRSYNNASRFLFDQWPNFQGAQACLYEKNGMGYLMNNEVATCIESDEYQLYGSTTVMINGVLTAIVDIEASDSHDDITAILVHEMFHVHQLSHWGEMCAPNPEWLMTYPNDYNNEYIRLKENQHLLALYYQQTDDLQRFRALRNQRQSYLKECFNDYEKNVETFEGCAYFLQLAYLQTLAKNDENFLEYYDLGQLDKASVRKHYLAKGAIMAMVLEDNYPSWRVDVDVAGKSLMDIIDELNHDELHMEAIEEHVELRKKVDRIDQKRKEIFSRFMESPTIVKMDFSSFPEIRCVDPMHMDALDNHMIFHQNTIQLGKGNSYLMIDGLPCITVYDTSIWKVKSVYINGQGIDKSALQTGVYKNEHIELNWTIVHDEPLTLL